jgi:tetratricopeptide (TPR) repeat protein
LGDRRAYFYLGQLYEAGGDLTAAETAYRRGFSAHTTSENVPVTIYGRFGGSDLAPQLLRLGISPTQAAPWLALARLLEDQSRLAEAEQVYRLLLAEDPFLAKAQRGLAVLEDR